MKILLVEDDHFHASFFASALRKHYGDNAVVTVVKNEKQFVRNFDAGIVPVGYDLVIFDQMLPWTHEDDEELDDDVPPQGPLRAGTRCWEKLRKHPVTREIPAIFLTNLESGAVPADVPYVRKRDDPDLHLLLEETDRLLKAGSPS